MSIEPKIEISDVSNTSRLDAFAKDAAKQVFFVPVNIESADEPIFTSTLATVTKLARQQGVAFGVYPTEPSTKFLEQRSIDWFGPPMLISSLLYTNNPNAVSIAFGMIANYLTSIFSGRQDDVAARFEIYVQDDVRKVTKKIQYNGPVCGLEKIDPAIKAVFSGNLTEKKIEKKLEKKIGKKISKKTERKTGKKTGQKTGKKTSKKTERKVEKKTEKKVEKKPEKKAEKKS